MDKPLKEIALPPDCVIVSIRRGPRVVVPRGNTQLLAGDRVIALASPACVERLRQTLMQGDGQPATEQGHA